MTLLADVSLDPNGVEGDSHGFRAVRREADDAEPVDHVRPYLVRPDGAEDGPAATFPPRRRGGKLTSIPFHEFRSLRELHPWLQPCAPLGATTGATSSVMDPRREGRYGARGKMMHPAATWGTRGATL